MKNYILIFAALFIASLPLQAKVSKTVNIEEINASVTPDTVVFFNIAEVLMDTEISLGSQAWRKYLRSRVDAKLHDEITLFVFQNVPPKAPEEVTSALVLRLQQRENAVFAFTSRGRNEWYSSQVPGVDLITEGLLNQIGIDFTKTKLPPQLAHIQTEWSDFYHGGIIYATNAFEKCEILEKMLEKFDYVPSHIVFVDDKMDSLTSLEAMSTIMGIPFSGYAYSRTALNHQDFDPTIANIQLEWLLSHGQLLSDHEARTLSSQYSDIDKEQHFMEIIEKWRIFSKKSP